MIEGNYWKFIWKELNLAQHSQKVANSQGWKKNLYYSWLCHLVVVVGCLGGGFFMSFLYLLIWLLFHSASQVSLGRDGKGWEGMGMELFCSHLSPSSCWFVKTLCVLQQITYFRVLVSNLLNLVTGKSQMCSVSRGKSGNLISCWFLSALVPQPCLSLSCFTSSCFCSWLVHLKSFVGTQWFFWMVFICDFN